MPKLYTAFLLVLMFTVTLPLYGGPSKNRSPKPGDKIDLKNGLVMTMVDKNEERLTTSWAIVVDTSHSTWGIFNKIIRAFQLVTQAPSDQLRFCAYSFNNAGCHKYRDWRNASPKAFLQTEKWLRKTRGVSSYASMAIRDAIRQPIKKLTVIIISDGGFTEGIEDIKSTIRKAQKWRSSRGFGPAIICTIGVENKLCRPAYPKNSDKVCQKGMRDIGTTGHGGYFYVKRKDKK